MAKLALCSRRVVTFDKSAPYPAVVLIEGDTIVDVVEFDPQSQNSDVLAAYAEWNPIDYFECVVSPGQIDSSVKINPDWESIAEASSAAVASGVTLMLVETNLFQAEVDYSTLYCDCGEVRVVSCPEEVRCDGQNRPVAVKGYLFSPNSSVSEVQKLSEVFAEAREASLPVVIDPLTATDRVFMMASPCRRRPYFERLTTSDTEINFAAAYPDDVESEASEGETHNVYDLRSALLESSKEQSPGLYKLLSKATTPLRNSFKSSTHKPEVVSSLNKRLRNQDRGMKVLSQADAVTYVDSGTTTFSSITMVLKEVVEVKSHQKSPPSAFQGRLSSRRPTPILTEKKNSAASSSKLEQMYSRYLANYPETFEVNGVEVVLKAFAAQKCKLHLTNISSSSAYRQVILARDAGQELTCEVSLSHLYFSADKVKMSDTRFKASPPVRSEANRMLLWELLQLKVINSVSSTHFAVPTEYKEIDGGNFRKAVSGINCLGYTGQALWSLLYKAYQPQSLQHLITRHAKWTSFEPAKIFGLSQRYGSIERGKRADFCIWRPEVLSATDKTSKLGTCVYAGEELLGKVEAVYIRGQLAYARGKCMAVGRRIIQHSLP